MPPGSRVVLLHALALCACNAILGLDELPVALAPPHAGADGGDVLADGASAQGSVAGDGSGAPPTSSDAGDDAPSDRPRLVFTSQPLRPGEHFSNRGVANDYCTDSLGRPAVAWLSDTFGNAIDSLPDRTWVNTQGDIVFADKASIIGGRGPEHSIFPRGYSDLSTLVWTGTSPKGEVVRPAESSTCSDWSKSADSTAVVGNPDARLNGVATTWTNAKAGQSCYADLRVYCFEL